MDGEALVGRAREHAWLTGHVEATLAGHGSLVLLAGEAGVGKTTLARAALAGSGLTVLEGFGTQAGGPAFGPVVEVLRAGLRSGARPALAAGPLAAHLALLLPELGPTAVDGDVATLVEAIRQAFAALAAGRPTAVLLDDLQWADDATLELLPTLARGLDQHPLLVVGAFRSDELPRAHGIRRVRGELRRAGVLEQLAVEPLDAAGTTALLERALGPVGPSLGRAVHERTDGVPFFVGELASALAAGDRLVSGPEGLELAGDAEVPLPDDVRDAVLLHAADLSDEARAAAMAASVAGQEFDPDLVTAIAGLPAWPDDLLRRRIVVEAGDSAFAFRHALVRDAFYAEIPWTRRRALHRATASELESRHAAPAVVAEHWVLGRDPDRARVALLAAADAFCRLRAYRDAERSYRRALDLWPDEGPDAPPDGDRLDVLERLAACAELDRNLADAVPALREVVEGRARQGDDLQAAMAHRRLAAVLELRGRWQEALTSREQAASAFSAAGRPADAAIELITAAAQLRIAGSLRAALNVLVTARAQARAAGRVDLEARALGQEGNVRARMGEGRDGVELVRAGLALALEHGSTTAAAEIYQRLGDALEHAGDYDAAKETYDEAFGFCAANDLEPTAQLCLACLTAVLRQSGEWDRAAALCRQVLGSPASAPHPLAVASGILGSILGLRGQVRRARPLLLESVTVSRRIELAAMELLALWGLAVLDQAEGATESAAAHCWAVLRRWEQTEDRHFVVPALRWSATFFGQSGNVDGARACAAGLAVIATDTGQAEAMSALAHALGETALLDGEPEQAIAEFAQALQLLAGVDVPFDRAETQRRSAAALAAAGLRQEAVAQLVAAHRTAGRLGAAPLVAQVTATLASLGERPDQRFGRRAADRIANGGLTRRELEVVRLVAGGSTNREIAGNLFLSHRTVEMHVSSIMTKLDCRSRLDAARRAAELGLLPAPS